VNKVFLLVLCFTGLFAHARAQGHLVIIQDPALDEVLARRIEYNKKAAVSSQGFRILIYSGSQRQDAYNAQMKFRNTYTDKEAYLSYQFPNFKVMAGDFRSRDDAAKAASELKTMFPGESLLIIPQRIDVTKLKE